MSSTSGSPGSSGTSGAPTAVLVVNAGSSSLKYQLIDVATSTTLGSGLIEKIGEPQGRAAHQGVDDTYVTDTPVHDHEEAFAVALHAFDEHGPRLADHPLLAVGHRVVHGGTSYSAPALITDELVQAVTELIPLAPLHNPPNLQGIAVALQAFPGVPQVAVFDTAFHQTMPAHAYTYAIPKDWREQHHVRRYGFHGTSHAYVSRAAAAFLGKAPADVNVIVLHVGNGASASAVAGGVCVDTSMGLTPLEGLVMGTRPGDIDPGLASYMMGVGLTPSDYDTALNTSCGLKALAGSNDYRDIEAAADGGDPAARLALDVAAYRLRKYLGAYTFALGHVDAVAFTAGAGENSSTLRALVVAGLEDQGLVLDAEANDVRSRDAHRISTQDSPVALLVIPTQEELEIAQQAARLVRHA